MLTNICGEKFVWVIHYTEQYFTFPSCLLGKVFRLLGKMLIIEFFVIPTGYD